MLDDYAALIAEGRVHVIGSPDLTGILVLIPETDALLLDNIAVAPGAQGTGVGKRLMATALEAAQEAVGGSTLPLSGSSNPVARWTGRSSITPPISSSVR